MIYTALCITILMRAASITWPSGKGLGPENLDCFGPHMALSYWLSAISQDQKISQFPAVLRIRIQIHRIHMFWVSSIRIH